MIIFAGVLQGKFGKMHFVVERKRDKDGQFSVKELVFCYQNCSDLLREKIVLVIEKNF